MRVRTLKSKGSVTNYRIVLAGLAAGLILATAGRAMAADIFVNGNAPQGNDGICTLREAILNANADNQSGSTDCAAGSGADRITFILSDLVSPTGDQAGPLPAITSDVTIDGGGLEYRYGAPEGSPRGVAFSGLVVASGASLTLRNLQVSGITNFGTLTFANNLGGNIVNAGTATVVNSYSGAIRNCRTLRVANSTFSGAAARGENGYDIYNGDINTDTVTCVGMGVATMTITNSTFMNGGHPGNKDISCVVCSAGAAIYNGGVATITNTTIYNNSGGDTGPGGGILNAGMATIANSILARNFIERAGPTANCRGVNPVIDGGNNIEDAATCGFKASNNSKPNTDPLLDPNDPSMALKLNGGPTPTVLPCTSVGQPAGCTGRSPAVDAGNNAICMAAPVDKTDQRGFVRPADGDGDGIAICDIGAAEANATLPPVIDSLVTFSPIQSTLRTTSTPPFTPGTVVLNSCNDVFFFPPGPTFPIVGQFSFIARLAVKNTSPALYDLKVKVTALTNGNFLLNGTYLGAEGTVLTIAPPTQRSDGSFRPGEFVDVPFVICLKQSTPFTFLVDVLGLTR